MYISYVKIEPNNFIGEGITWSFSASDDSSNNWRWCQQSSFSCSDKVFFNPNNSITVVNSGLNEIGIYTCELKSLAGKVSKSKTTYFPELSTAADSKNQYYVEGDNFLFDCELEVITLYKCIKNYIKCKYKNIKKRREISIQHYIHRFIQFSKRIQQLPGLKMALC